MGSIFQPRIFADFFIVLVPGKVHAQDGVVVVCAGKFRRGLGDEHLDELVDIHATSANNLDANTLRHIARLYYFFCGHTMPFPQLDSRSLVLKRSLLARLVLSYVPDHFFDFPSVATLWFCAICSINWRCCEIIPAPCCAACLMFGAWPFVSSSLNSFSSCF